MRVCGHADTRGQASPLTNGWVWAARGDAAGGGSGLAGAVLDFFEHGADAIHSLADLRAMGDAVDGQNLGAGADGEADGEAAVAHQRPLSQQADAVRRKIANAGGERGLIGGVVDRMERHPVADANARVFAFVLGTLLAAEMMEDLLKQLGGELLVAGGNHVR